MRASHAERPDARWGTDALCHLAPACFRSPHRTGVVGENDGLQPVAGSDLGQDQADARLDGRLGQAEVDHDVPQRAWRAVAAGPVQGDHEAEVAAQRQSRRPLRRADPEHDAENRERGAPTPHQGQRQRRRVDDDHPGRHSLQPEQAALLLLEEVGDRGGQDARREQRVQYLRTGPVRGAQADPATGQRLVRRGLSRPFGPTKPVTTPGSTVKSRSSTAVLSP
jgi:hypothetical protein